MKPFFFPLKNLSAQERANPKKTFRSSVTAIQKVAVILYNHSLIRPKKISIQLFDNN